MNKKYQVFTPTKYVNFLLDSVNYKNDLYGKKFLENSCGKGDILKEVVSRYIKDCIKRGYENDKIKKGLEQDIYGYEIDEEIAKLCCKNLNDICNSFGIKNVNWNIRVEDFLFYEVEELFFYIVGNPPYIKYKDIEEDTREKIRTSFKSCEIGKFDYCYPFIEKSLRLLHPCGSMAYLIPNSIFKNVFAEELRKIMVESIVQIFDYKSRKIFPKVLTSSAIIIFNKRLSSTTIKYKNMINYLEKDLLKSELFDKWIFSSNNNKANNKFSDYFHASVSVATLYNKAYILTDKLGLEEAVVKKAASPKSLIKGKNEYIIFPYYFEDNNLKRYTFEDFKQKFPQAYSHLLKYKTELNKRKVDKNCAWHEYGRSQAIAKLNQEKLILSTVVTKTVKVFKLGPDDIPYSGIIITLNRENREYDLNLAKKILESNSFLYYVKKIGINATGGALRITANDINNFNIDRFIPKREE